MLANWFYYPYSVPIRLLALQLIFMLNSVSDRIRTLIKTQEQATPQSLLYRSRQNSVESIRSGTQSKTMIQIPPKSPNKTRSQVHKSEHSQENNQTAQRWDYSEIVEQVKVKVMQSVYPLLVELTKKVDSLAHQANANIIKDMQNQWTQIQSKFQAQLEQVRHQIQGLRERQNVDIRSQITRLENKYDILTQKVQKISLTQILNEQLRRPQTPKLTQNPGQQMKTRQKQVQIQQIKCKCQKLVEQILKSQNHLMMELKYVKHFQNYNVQSPNSTGNVKNYGSRGR